MSAKATFWAWEQSVSSSSKLVLLCLADCHNADSGQCNPSVSYISNKTGLNRKTVMIAVQNLFELGLISVEKHNGTQTNYRIIFDATSTEIGTGKNMETSTNTGTSTGIGTGTKNGTTPVPKTAPLPVPNLGHEPISNLKKNLKEKYIGHSEPENQKPKTIKTRINPQAELTEHCRTLALEYWKEKNRPDLDAENQFNRFKNHHLSAGTKSANWQASWTTWYCNAVEYTRPPLQVIHASQQATPRQIKTLRPAGSEQ